MPVPPCARHLSTPWFSAPGSAEPGVQLFAIGDVHGRGNTLDAALAGIRNAPRKAERRVLVFLGDLIDRGPQSLECLEKSQNAQTLALVDEVVVLPGNHEIMMAQAIEDPDFMMDPWLACGGAAVLHEAGLDEEAPFGDTAAALTERLPPGWARTVLNAQGFWASNDFLFVHAGVHPHHPIGPFLAQKPDAPGPMENHWAWIREPFLSWGKGWDDLGRLVVVHGHTPAVEGWIGADADMAALVRLERRRLALDADAGRRGQIAWAEIVGARARVSCVQTGRGDAF